MNASVMIEPEVLYLREAEDAPNNSVLPVLIYRAIVKSNVKNKAEAFEKHFAENEWSGVWRDTVYTHRHFHSNAHEALGFAKGGAKIELGGAQGKVIIFKAGDLLVLPAGTAHRRVAGSRNLSVVGAYPKGQGHYNMCRTMDECRDAKHKIADVALPVADPFYGKDGPLMRAWQKNNA
ncbi:MAG: cupin [Alphaproteobacteria bacterium]|nr:cupin [Alphaproteobacteria bacterium]